MQHELGHQLHYELWNDKLPAQAPGAHTWFDCIDRGKALTEGFADFVPSWSQNDRTVVPEILVFFSIESPGPSAASSGASPISDATWKSKHMRREAS